MTLGRHNIQLANQGEMAQEIGRIKKDHADTRTVIERVVVEHVPEMMWQLISEEATKAASKRLSGAVRTQPLH